MRRSVFLAAFALIPATAALAVGPPMSPEIPVNTTTTGIQIVSSAAMDGAGNFVVVWETPDADGDGISARLFDSSGNPTSGEFAVSTGTGDQYDPWVAGDTNGDFVVVWTSYGQLNATNSEVYARRYVGGNPAGPEFLVNTYTTGDQFVVGQSVAMSPSGEFVVVWTSVGQDGDGYGAFGQRFDASGNKLGTEFRVNTTTADYQSYPAVAMNESRQFVVAWQSYAQDGDNYGVFARRYDAAGAPLTGETPVNTYTTDSQHVPSIGTDRDGNFVVVWNSFDQDGDFDGIFGRRFDAAGTPLTGEFPINTFTTSQQLFPTMAMDAEGNFVCTWESFGQGGGPASFGVLARAFNSSAAPVTGEFQINATTTSGGQLPAIAMGQQDNFVISWGRDASGDENITARLSSPSAGVADVDARSVAGSSSNVNGILEAGETVQVAPHWKNVLASSFAVTGTASNARGPAGPTYTLDDTTAGYGTIGAGATSDCFGATTDCYLVTVSGTRPAPHWDAEFDETLSTGTVKTWRLHVGESFPDVLTTDTFYSYVETLFHNQITGGCTGGNYCPGNPVTRAQMAVFLMKSVHGAGYLPPACAGVFADVPCPSQFADWIEQLAAEGITGGCGGGNYCPNNPVTRQQMAVFLLKAEHGSGYTPPSCTGVFGDVPCPSQFADWIEQLADEGITGGCGGGNYCPGNPNTRAQMAIFLTKTFGLTLYPP
jgi:hypothetical protein